MQRGRGGRDDFFGFGDQFAGFGGIRQPGSLISSFFGGMDSFDDPFFTRPFGSMMSPGMFGQSMLDPSMLGPGMLGPGMFADQGTLFGEMSNGGLLEQGASTNRSKGPIIQELSSDDEGEAGKADDENKENPRKHASSSKEPYVQDPDEAAEEKKSRYMNLRNDFNRSTRKQPQGHSFSFQSSTVTYGGPNGPYFTSSMTRRTSGNGVTVEESKEADTTTGRASHRISRGIGGKGHSIKRNLGSDGRVDTLQTLYNLNEDELPFFEETWKGNAERHLPGLRPGSEMLGNGSGSSRRHEQLSRGWALPSTEQLRETEGMKSKSASGSLKARGSMK